MSLPPGSVNLIQALDLPAIPSRQSGALRSTASREAAIRSSASARTAEAVPRTSRTARAAAALRDIFALLAEAPSSHEIASGRCLFRRDRQCAALFAQFGGEKRFFVMGITRPSPRCPAWGAKRTWLGKHPLSDRCPFDILQSGPLAGGYRMQ